MGSSEAQDLQHGHANRRRRRHRILLQHCRHRRTALDRKRRCGQPVRKHRRQHILRGRRGNHRTRHTGTVDGSQHPPKVIRSSQETHRNAPTDRNHRNQRRTHRSTDRPSQTRRHRASQNWRAIRSRRHHCKRHMRSRRIDAHRGITPGRQIPRRHRVRRHSIPQRRSSRYCYSRGRRYLPIRHNPPCRKRTQLTRTR